MAGPSRAPGSLPARRSAFRALLGLGALGVGLWAAPAARAGGEVDEGWFGPGAQAWPCREACGGQRLELDPSSPARALPAPPALAPQDPTAPLEAGPGQPTGEGLQPTLPAPSARLEPGPSRPAPGPGLRTSWGYGPRENLYNETILAAVSRHWPHREISLPPALFKALVAAESAFNPAAISRTGAAGLVQLTPDTARRFGLSPGLRTEPERAVPVGVRVLAEKAQALLAPGDYPRMMGRRPEEMAFALKVSRALQGSPRPTDEQFWPLMLAAYNGGGGTVLRAQAAALDLGQDPRCWAGLVGDPTRPQASPLYRACQQVYGRGAAGKYRELSRYPEKVLRLYRGALGGAVGGAVGGRAGQG